MGKKGIDMMSYRSEKRARQQAVTQRGAGLLGKAMQYGAMTGAKILLRIHNEEFDVRVEFNNGYDESVTPLHTVCPNNCPTEQKAMHDYLAKYFKPNYEKGRCTPPLPPPPMYIDPTHHSLQQEMLTLKRRLVEIQSQLNTPTSTPDGKQPPLKILKQEPFSGDCGRSNSHPPNTPPPSSASPPGKAFFLPVPPKKTTTTTNITSSPSAQGFTNIRFDNSTTTTTTEQGNLLMYSHNTNTTPHHTTYGNNTCINQQQQPQQPLTPVSGTTLLSLANGYTNAETDVFGTGMMSISQDFGTMTPDLFPTERLYTSSPATIFGPFAHTNRLPLTPTTTLPPPAAVAQPAASPNNLYPLATPPPFIPNLTLLAPA